MYQMTNDGKLSKVESEYKMHEVKTYNKNPIVRYQSFTAI